MKKWLAFLFLALFGLPLCPATASPLDNLGNGLSYSEVSARLNRIEKLTTAKKPDID